MTQTITYSFKRLIPLLFIFALYSQCEQTQKDDRLKLIIDADTANEVDDLYAIIRAVIEPSFNLLGITSAQFHTSPYATDSTVLDDIILPLGSNSPLVSDTKAQISEASSYIIQQAHALNTDDTLHIAILGSCTNVASAIIQDPTIIPKIAVHYIGFWHDHETNSYDKKEFNSGNDTIAVDVLLNTVGLNFNVMTATTCQHLVFDRKSNGKYLTGNSGIGQLLVDRWDSYTRWWTKEDPEKEKWIMWDVAIIEALINESWATKIMLNTPPENTQRKIGIYTAIDVDLMKRDFWSSLDAFIKSKS